MLCRMLVGQSGHVNGLFLSFVLPVVIFVFNPLRGAGFLLATRSSSSRRGFVGFAPGAGCVEGFDGFVELGGVADDLAVAEDD